MDDPPACGYDRSSSSPILFDRCVLDVHLVPVVDPHLPRVVAGGICVELGGELRRLERLVVRQSALHVATDGRLVDPIFKEHLVPITQSLAILTATRLADWNLRLRSSFRRR